MAYQLQNPDAPASYGQKAAIGILLVDAAFPELTKGEASAEIDVIKKGSEDDRNGIILEATQALERLTSVVD